MLYLVSCHCFAYVGSVPSPQNRVLCFFFHVFVFNIFFEILGLFELVSVLNLSTILFENQNTTASVAMEMKYLQVGISN